MRHYAEYFAIFFFFSHAISLPPFLLITLFAQSNISLSALYHHTFTPLMREQRTQQPAAALMLLLITLMATGLRALPYFHRFRYAALFFAMHVVFHAFSPCRLRCRHIGVYARFSRFRYAIH